jgi:hypothetical protein
VGVQGEEGCCWVCKNLGGLLEIEVYFSYLDRIGLLKIVFV